MESILLLIALQLAFVSTILVAVLLAALYLFFIVPPPTPSTSIPFFLANSAENLVGKTMSKEPGNDKIVPHTTGGRYA